MEKPVESAQSVLAAAAHHVTPQRSHRLKGKIAVVTGASSGIGRQISVAYAREGAKVVVADISDKSRAPEEAKVATHELIQKEGGEAEFLKLDVTDLANVESVVQDVVAKFGRLDIWVNNAGIVVDATTPKPVWEVTTEQWDKTMAVNATGVFYGTRAATAQMVQQEPHPNGDRGWVVNLASVFGLVGNAFSASYVASKHTVMGLTKVAALDCAPYRVHVNAICPGWVQSSFTASVLADPATKEMALGLHPFRGLGTPEDIAGVAVFLASDDARWITGTGVVVDGAYTAR